MTIKETKKLIAGCNSFEKDWNLVFKLEYIDYAKTWETWIDKDWKERDQLEKVIKPLFIPWSKFNEDKNYAWKSPKEICQELPWKSLVISTKIW